jgi:lipopolysaccharide/colanic/teichoic acid biosynthesis glycosyltransferase
MISTGARVFRQDKASQSSAAFYPGGWGDRIVFGYMFRVVSSLAAVILPACLVVAWGFLNNWHMTNAMLYFFGATVVFMVAIGEMMRVGVYERRSNSTQHKHHIEDYSSITPEILEQYGKTTIGYRFIKRCIDLIFSTTALVVTFPLLTISALLVRFDSPGPIFYKERVVGFKGKPFARYRLRTMYVADGDSDPVTSRAGKYLRGTSIDELPQIINVILGDMSIVGPRPLSMRHMSPKTKYASAHVAVQAKLLDYAKPGITGISSADGSPKETALMYIIKRSIWLDLAMMVGTINIVVRRDAF